MGGKQTCSSHLDLLCKSLQKNKGGERINLRVQIKNFGSLNTKSEDGAANAAPFMSKYTKIHVNTHACKSPQK